MTEYFGGGHPAVGGANHHVKQLVAGLIKIHIAANKAGDIDIKMLGHGPQGPRIGAELDDRQNRVADNIALAGREKMNDKAGGGTRVTCSAAAEEESWNQRPGPVGSTAFSRAPTTGALVPIFWMLPKCFFFDRGQAAFNISFGRLRVGEIIGLMIVDYFHSDRRKTGILADFFIGAALENQMFAAGQFSGFTKEDGIAFFIEFVVGITNRRVGCNTGCGIRLAAFGGNPEFTDIAFNPLIC